LAKHSGFFGHKKRQKEIARLEKQKEKRERRLRPKVRENDTDPAEPEIVQGSEGTDEVNTTSTQNNV
jgi:hypothetical protein